MTVDPNINATPQSVADSLAGTVDGSPLSFRQVAMLAASEIFSLSGDVEGVTPYPFPEGPNTSTSAFDNITTLSKILTRTWVGPDGKTYDLFDAIMTLLNKQLSA
jgi:hypothetical protein